MKLNLSTPSKAIVDTLTREWTMASEAFTAHHGGPKRYDKWQDQVLAELSRREDSFIADKFLWTSPDGNKWCIFEHATYDHASSYMHTCHYCFCYYETLPYAGIFFHITYNDRHTGAVNQGAIIYESHFFERLQERGIMDWHGIDTLIDFIAANHANMLFGDDPDADQVDIRIGDAIGRGFRDRDYRHLVRIKTVLGDEHLTTRQRLHTALGRRISDSINKYIDLKPKDSMMRQMARLVKAAANGNTEELLNEVIRDFARSQGISFDEAQTFSMYIATIETLITTIKPSLTGCTDTDYHVHVANICVDLKNKWENEHPSEQEYITYIVDRVMKLSNDLHFNFTRPLIRRAIGQLRRSQGK